MKKTTGELLELLKKSSNASSYIENATDDLIQQIPLSDYLSEIMDSKQISRSDIVHRSGLDRGYVYEILSGKKTPSRDKVLAICFAAPFSADETQQLLKSTGYPTLYARIERDSIILFALEYSLSLTDANELLYEMNHPLLE